jgi:2-dehydro-3-deoxygluconokinase
MPLVWRNRVGAIGVRQGHLLESDWYEVEIVDRLGAGDALASGVIHGLLNDDWEQAISVGAALGALKHSVPGDFPWITPDEVQAVLKGSSLRIQR